MSYEHPIKCYLKNIFYNNNLNKLVQVKKKKVNSWVCPRVIENSGLNNSAFIKSGTLTNAVSEAKPIEKSCAREV